METIYFAHPISSYGSEEEKQVINYLSKSFNVVNPSSDIHQNKVKELREQFNDRSASSKAIMAYFVDVCSSCDTCAVLPFPDGTLGAGTVQEAQSFLDKNKPVHKVIHKGEADIKTSPINNLEDETCLSVEDTRAMLRKLSPTYR